MAVEGHELRTQLANPVDEGSDQICFGPLADMRGAECLDLSASRFAFGYERTNTRNLV